VSIVDRLLEWFRVSARRLPWRREPRDPYRVLVSELMLQQTQVDRVVPRFERFVARFPTLRQLASATEQEVLAEWSGLGYYRRARMLHRLALELGRGGRIPSSYEALRRLPGVGPYTAAAVASLAFGHAVPVVDGNVMRVAARIHAWPQDLRTAVGRRKVVDWVGALIADGPPAAVNEALMELGATVCLPSSPSCGQCPLVGECRARAEGDPEAYPAPRSRRPSVDLRWVAACCVDERGRWLVRQVTDGPILRGLWLPPLAELGDGDQALERALWLVTDPMREPPLVLPEVRHSITHRRIRIQPVRLAVRGAECRAPGRWVDPRRCRLPTSSLFEKLLRVSVLEQNQKT
jgi:A/G-specific adenine glycosylase